MDLKAMSEKISKLNLDRLIRLSQELLSSTTFDDNSDIRIIIKECLPNEQFHLAVIGLQSALLREITERVRLLTL